MIHLKSTKYYHLLCTIYYKSGSEYGIDEWFSTKQELQKRLDHLDEEYGGNPQIKKIDFHNDEESLGEMFNHVPLSEIMKLNEDIRILIEANTINH
ncbi:hypothetical protein ACIQZM_15285 [Peribacillus sp. NPDC097206]|uniref:hypothetical protein n=1 Tax=unclassified Peribacillus TaxID=2675266 RepID=UPI0037F857DB